MGRKGVTDARFLLLWLVTAVRVEMGEDVETAFVWGVVASHRKRDIILFVAHISWDIGMLEENVKEKGRETERKKMKGRRERDRKEKHRARKRKKGNAKRKKRGRRTYLQKQSSLKKFYFLCSLFIQFL